MGYEREEPHYQVSQTPEANMPPIQQRLQPTQAIVPQAIPPEEIAASQQAVEVCFHPEPCDEAQECEEVWIQTDVSNTDQASSESVNNLLEVKAMKNVYMEQAMNQAQDLERELQVKRKQASVPRVLERRIAEPASTVSPGISSDSTNVNNLGVRITGWWRWKTVVVPPNMYVVHTRRGYKKPLHVGLGISFSYKPQTDSFLVIPSAMQTIIINANSICKELQGILIQGYVQWIIDNVEIAYQRLDFSDMEDPMRVVNVQLREQAEAAIKDKVATMSIREVLSDKQPIIKELTRRLKEVAEGSGDDRGLGIRIVTVQIKEAIVSSAELWQNLQKPFRASQKTAGRLAEIENDSQVASRELEEKKQRETSELETNSEIEKLRSQKQAEQFDWQHFEAVRRQQIEYEAKRKRVETEIEMESKEHQLRKEQEFEAKKKEAELAIESYKMEEMRLNARHVFEILQLEKQGEFQKKQAVIEALVKDETLKAHLERERKVNEAKNEQTEKEIAFEEKRRQIANMLSSELVQSKALEMLPQIARSLPQPEMLHAISIGGDGANSSSLPGLTAAILGVLESYGISMRRKKEVEKTEEKPPAK